MCCSDAACPLSQVEVLAVLEDGPIAQVHGHDVRRVDLTGNRDQRNHAPGSLLLKPKAIDSNVANFGNASPVQKP